MTRTGCGWPQLFRRAAGSWLYVADVEEEVDKLTLFVAVVHNGITLESTSSAIFKDASPFHFECERVCRFVAFFSSLARARFFLSEVTVLNVFPLFFFLQFALNFRSST